MLLVGLRRRQVIAVGSPGVVSFVPGAYVYVGRAKRGMAARIARHLRRYKRPRWHIDMLLAEGEVLAVAVLQTVQECELMALLEKLWKSSETVKGFGASDCRCESHLLWVSRDVGGGLRSFRRLLSELEVRGRRKILTIYF